MGQSELIETNILYVLLLLVLPLSFVKPLGAKIDGDNSAEKQCGVTVSGQHLKFFTRNP